MTLTRRTPLARRTPLRPSKLPAAPRSTERKGPERSLEFLAFVRRLPCFYCRTTVAVEAHHWGKRGLGQKCSDFETVPLCKRHHQQWHTEGTLPNASRSEWLDAFATFAAKLRTIWENRRGRSALLR